MLSLNVLKKTVGKAVWGTFIQCHTRTELSLATATHLRADLFCRHIHMSFSMAHLGSQANSQTSFYFLSHNQPLNLCKCGYNPVIRNRVTQHLSVDTSILCMHVHTDLTSRSILHHTFVTQLHGWHLLVWVTTSGTIYVHAYRSNITSYYT